MRMYLIMKDFINSNIYLSLDYFVQKYDVSKRTIQNDLSYLMRISPRKGFTFHNKRGSGYLLEITNEELFKDFMESLNEGIYFQVKERPAQILAYLAIQTGYISMNNIADTFQVSKTVIKHDMNDVENLAKNYHFELERKTHYGILLRYELTSFKKYLVKINYNELLNVIEYLKIVIYIAHRQDEQKEEFIFDKNNEIHRIVEFLVGILEKKYAIGLSKKSIEEILKVLQKNIKREIGSISSFTNYLKEDIEEFIKQIDEKYDTKFLEDEDFKKMLLTHVSLLIDRLHNKISYQNPLANELNITYPMMFNIALQFCSMLHEKYNVEVTFDEIGFVAMHFASHMEKEKQGKLLSYNRIGIVCSSGGGSAYMIKIQIESLFPQAEVQTFSFLQQDELKTFQPDLIFTIMPLSQEIKAPIIYIKELLDDRDLVKIKQILQCEEYDPYTLIQDNPMYYSFFSKDFFKFIEADSYENIIRMMGQELEEKGYGKKGYTDLIFERESYVSTIYTNGVCIPHPLETDALKNMISVAILKKPFVQNGKEIKIVFMICLKKDQVEIYKVITKKLYRLMQKSNYVEMLTKVDSFEEMMNLMKEIGGGNNE